MWRQLLSLRVRILHSLIVTKITAALETLKIFYLPLGSSLVLNVLIFLACRITNILIKKKERKKNLISSQVTSHLPMIKYYEDNQQCQNKFIYQVFYLLSISHQVWLWVSTFLSALCNLSTCTQWNKWIHLLKCK